MRAAAWNIGDDWVNFEAFVEEARWSRMFYCPSGISNVFTLSRVFTVGTMVALEAETPALASAKSVGI